MMPLCFAGAAAEDVSDLEAALAEPISLSIQQDSLENCLQEVAKKTRDKHAGFAIKISGSDLASEGLTRNQSIRGFEAADRPGAEILTQLLIRANPDRNVTEASDPRLKLVWVVSADPSDADKQVILITTRAAAKKRGDKLPRVFRTTEDAR
jgi:hypothetical protein